MGESVPDRAAMLYVLATFDPHPEIVPGAPLAKCAKVDALDLVRMVATAAS